VIIEQSDSQKFQYLIIPLEDQDDQESLHSIFPLEHTPITPFNETEKKPQEFAKESMEEEIVDSMEEGNSIPLVEEIDISLYTRLPMRDAAKIIGMPCSTLGKKWKKESKGRAWPFRRLSKISKEIAFIIGCFDDSNSEQNERLQELLEERRIELLPIILRRKIR